MVFFCGNHSAEFVDALLLIWTYHGSASIFGEQVAVLDGAHSVDSRGLLTLLTGGRPARGTANRKNLFQLSYERRILPSLP